MGYEVKQVNAHTCLRPNDFGYGLKHHDWRWPIVGDIWRCDECGQRWQYVKNGWWRQLQYCGPAEWRRIDG